MGKLDPRLRHLAQRLLVDRSESAAVRALAAEETELAEILIRCVGSATLQALRQQGAEIDSVIPGPYLAVSGRAPFDRLPSIAQLPGVAEIEAARPLVMDLDQSLAATRTTVLHEGDPAVTGEGALVAVIDSGIDYTHPNFRHADGSSRIRFLWDQRGPTLPGGPVPFGREYTQDDLNEALRLTTPHQSVSHTDRNGHGTHVAGIAAGNGRAGDTPFCGVAPGAELIVVAYRGEGVTIGRSTRALAAFAYVVEKARALGRPVAVNFSQGMNGGGHSGETVLETGLDNLAREPGVVLVKSAGNEQDWNIHASGTVRNAQTTAVELSVQTNNRDDDVVEIWFSGEDRISVEVETPEGERLSPVALGHRRDFLTRAGNSLFIESAVNASDTGDTRVTLILSLGSAAFIQPGIWRLHLHGDAIRHGRFDAWIERSDRSVQGEQTRFSPGSAEPSSTISIPGTARRIITVGSYVTRPADGFGAPLGQISNFSSRGPTRYGVQKPEIAAPGELIISARSAHSLEPQRPDQWHTPMPGTSMAAPHVTGAAALVLGVRPDLNCEQVKQILMRSARVDGFASTAPDNVWGAGRLDCGTAVEFARSARFPVIGGVVVRGKRVSWETDIPTTGAVRFHTHQRQLQLGKSLGSRTHLTFDTRHEVDLSDLDPGDYFLEILAFSQDNWWSLEDNQGLLLRLHIPDGETERAGVPVEDEPWVMVDGVPTPWSP